MQKFFKQTVRVDKQGSTLFTATRKLRPAAIFALVLLLIFANVPLAPVAEAGVVTKSSPLSGLVGWWTFDGADVTDKVYDRSGFANNGYFAGGATSSAIVSGRLGKALLFDGVDDKVIVSSSPSVNPIGAMSFSLWAKGTWSGGSFNRVIQKGQGASDVGYGCAWSGAAKVDCWHTTTGGTEHVQGMSTPSTGVWHHLVVTYDGGTTVTIYLDGANVTTTAGSSAYGAANTELAIGNRAGAATQPFSGTIDDVRVYNRALTYAEVQQLYNFQQSVSPIKTAGDPYWNKTVLLIGNDNQPNNTTTVADQSTAAHVMTPGTPNKYSTASAPTGMTSSITFDGSASSKVTTPDSEDWNFGSGPFVIDFFIKMTVSGTVYNQSVDWSTAKAIAVRISATSVDVWTAANGWTSANTTITTGVWYHIAVVRSGSTMYVFKDGVPVSSWTDGSTFTNGTAVANVGGDFSGITGGFSGNLASFRMTKGTDRGWTTRFTPPPLPLPVYQRLAVKQKTNTSQNTSLTSGITGLWSFDGPDMAGVSGTLTAYDRSGNGNTATSTGGVTKTIGKIGQALSFNGTDGRLTTSKALSNFISATNGTISVWVRPQGSPASAAVSYGLPSIIADRNGNGALGNTIEITRGSISGTDRIWLGNWDGNQDDVGIPYTVGQWAHIVWVHTGSVLYGYKNGAFVDSIASGNTSDLTQNLEMGANYEAGGSTKYFNGQIDDVRFYNRALSPAEVKQLYLQGK